MFFRNTVFLMDDPNYITMDADYVNWAAYNSEDYWDVFLATMKFHMLQNHTLQTLTPPKRLRRKILDACKEHNYHAVILTDDKKKYKNEGFELSQAGPISFIEPRVKRFERAFVIGDVHGCVKPLTELLSLSKGYPIVFVGDLVDRGPAQMEVLDLVLEMLSNNGNEVALTPGNHDTSYKYRIGTDKGYDRSREISDKLDQVLEYRSDWVEGPDWIVTHSPCHPKYLRKNDLESLKRSINFKRSSQGLHTKEQIVDKMKSWARNNGPHHIFGHQVFNDVWRYKNLIGIDTGCVGGGKLTGFFTDTKTYVQVEGNK